MAHTVSEGEFNLSNRVVAAHAYLHVVLTNFQVSFKIQLLDDYLIIIDCLLSWNGCRCMITIITVL